MSSSQLQQAKNPLDENGRCCGHRPIAYLIRDRGLFLYCDQCDSAYSGETREMVPRTKSTIDAKRRCCGRKTLVYKKTGTLFCGKCCQSYCIVTREVIGPEGRKP
jgi:hypothetical protein